MKKGTFCLTRAKRVCRLIDQSETKSKTRFITYQLPPPPPLSQKKSEWKKTVSNACQLAQTIDSSMAWAGPQTAYRFPAAVTHFEVWFGVVIKVWSSRHTGRLHGTRLLASFKREWTNHEVCIIIICYRDTWAAQKLLGCYRSTAWV